MKKSLKKTLKTVLPISLGVFLVWYSYNATSEEDRAQIIFYIKEANMFWVGISVLMGILSHISRAIRWNYLLEPLGYKPKILNNIFIPELYVKLTIYQSTDSNENQDKKWIPYKERYDIQL